MVRCWITHPHHSINVPTIAVRTTLISARLSQPKKQITVIKATPPLPDLTSGSAAKDAHEAQWKSMLSKLQGWTTSLDGILDTVGQSVGPQEESEEAASPVLGRSALPVA